MTTEREGHREETEVSLNETFSPFTKEEIDAFVELAKQSGYPPPDSLELIKRFAIRGTNNVVEVMLQPFYNEATAELNSELANHIPVGHPKLSLVPERGKPNLQIEEQFFRLFIRNGNDRELSLSCILELAQEDILEVTLPNGDYEDTFYEEVQKFIWNPNVIPEIHLTLCT